MSTFPALRASNPLPGFNFAVRFGETEQAAAAVAAGGVSQFIAGFQEVTGLESSIEIHSFNEGGRNDFTHKFATTTNFGNITFKRGVALTSELWDWYFQVASGDFGARREITIAQLDTEGTAVLTWTVRGALPAKFTGPSWNSAQSSVAIESLEIAHEGLLLEPA
jgi:phage tail-like protein